MLDTVSNAAGARRVCRSTKRPYTGPMTASTAKPTARREQVKAALQAALVELATERPFREVRVEEITQAAGLSRSAFYFYYDDKLELLTEAARETVDALYEQADRWWHGDGEPAELIGDALSGIASLWAANAGVLRLVTEVSTYDQRVRDFWRGLVQRFIDATAEHLRGEQARGIAPEGLDPERVSEVLVWGSERVLYAYVATGDREPADVVAALTDLWMRAAYGR
jgi:TetR/AcrR family transcriptional regulator, ethionamide resistance regulator